MIKQRKEKNPIKPIRQNSLTMRTNGKHQSAPEGAWVFGGKIELKLHKRVVQEKAKECERYLTFGKG